MHGSSVCVLAAAAAQFDSVYCGNVHVNCVQIHIHLNFLFNCVYVKIIAESLDNPLPDSSQQPDKFLCIPKEDFWAE